MASGVAKSFKEEASFTRQEASSLGITQETSIPCPESLKRKTTAEALKWCLKIHPLHSQLPFKGPRKNAKHCSPASRKWGAFFRV